jgi:hypothetical protein
MKNLVIAVGIVAVATIQAIGQTQYSNDSQYVSLSASGAKGSSQLDPNYKRQAGNHRVEGGSSVTIKTEQNTSYDQNYKHQARREEGKKHTIAIKESLCPRYDGNYKHQFPAR